MREKSVIVLEALHNGITVNMDDREFCLDDDNILAIIGYRYNDNANLDDEPDEKILLPCDLPVGLFINMCNKLTDDEIAVIVGNLTLKKGVKER